MKNWWGIPFGVVCGLLGAGLLFLSASQPHGAPVQLQPPPTAPPLVVHVCGAVVNPGVYALPEGCRVQDALEAAGGLLPEADTLAVNFAALLQDGERLWIPARATRPPPELAAAPESTATVLPQTTEEQPPAGEPEYPININTASQSELEFLPGIGPVIAQRIIDYRTENGFFSEIADIQNVSGIGPKTFEKIKDLISVMGP